MGRGRSLDGDLIGASEPAGLAEARTEVATAAPPTATATPRPGPAPNSHIGRFTVLRPLGQGGMGVVVAAHDPLLDREVAIKLVSPGGGQSPDAAGERLVREARAMARLRHPNVVAVYEVGSHRDQVYLAMERVTGTTLRVELDRLRVAGELGWRAVVARFAAAARGLAAAHAAGIVHRDFKPENVLVDDDGRVLVADFGLADPPAAEPVTAGIEGADLPLTHADQVIGTPAYMAPEQHAGLRLDARADQFAFCVAFYEALYGELPFAGENRAEYVAAIAREDVRPPAPDRRVPAWLRETVVRGLAADPADRHASMEALIAELGVDPKQSWLHGRLERSAAIAATAAFVLVWVGAMLGLRVELSYKVHYATDLSFLAVVLLVFWIGRRTFARTSINGFLIGLGLVGGVGIVALTAGGHLLGIDPDALGALHLLVGAVLISAGAITFDRRLWIGGVAYLIGFLVAAAVPSLVLSACLVSHAVALTDVLWVARRHGGD